MTGAQPRSEDEAGSGGWRESGGGEGTCSDNAGESGTGIAAGQLGELSPGIPVFGAVSAFLSSTSTSISFPLAPETFSP